MNAISPITAARVWNPDRPTCVDCGSVAQGRSFFGEPYCGLCERTIREGDFALAPVIHANGGVWA
ncbi:hypothetical protein GCM10011380_00300 [Sphingomonas metalli]|uniref:Uncharacterized protein n=1 Tax=Sphingomonas metalli TaxID=1779358 RepID=A0A916SSW4_9SPHN|nr:hypothetical protein [Sphingomonas metalli]GGB14832.1 hypothetical protein GCM10011380_00300 [Sphingomonas metalli]